MGIKISPSGLPGAKLHWTVIDSAFGGTLISKSKQSVHCTWSITLADAVLEIEPRFLDTLKDSDLAYIGLVQSGLVSTTFAVTSSLESVLGGISWISFLPTEVFGSLSILIPPAESVQYIVAPLDEQISNSLGHFEGRIICW